MCVQHANRERQRAELEARQSKEAMASMGTRTAAAVAAHEATERVERAALRRTGQLSAISPRVVTLADADATSRLFGPN